MSSITLHLRDEAAKLRNAAQAHVPDEFTAECVSVAKMMELTAELYEQLQRRMAMADQQQEATDGRD